MTEKRKLTREDVAKQTQKCQALMIDACTETGNPYVAMAVLFELAGAAAAVVLRDDPGRVGEVIGMLDALNARVREAAAMSAPPTGPTH